MRAVAFFLALLSIVGSAAAHGQEHGLEDQLVEDGQKLIVGKFTAAQPGPLVVVPYIDDPPECAGTPSDGVTMRMGPEATVTFFVAPDGLHALFDLPPDPTGYAAMAVDTHEASRALLLMEETAVVLHALEAVAFRDGKTQNASGALGVPYTLPGSMGHGFNITVEGGGIVMQHDGSFRGGAVCAGDVPGHRAFSFFARALPESATPGRVVHVVGLYDPEVPYLIPRPIDGSTFVLQANLYLSRPGENTTLVKAAFTPTWSVADYAPLALVVSGCVWAVLPTRRTRP